MRKMWLACGHQGDAPAGTDPAMLICARCRATPFIPWHVRHMSEMPRALREAEPEDRDHAAIAVSRVASLFWGHTVRHELQAVRFQVGEFRKKCQASGLSGLDLAKVMEKQIEFSCLDPNITEPFRFVLGVEFVAPYLHDDKDSGTQKGGIPTRAESEAASGHDEREEQSSDDPIAAERSNAVDAHNRECLDHGIRIGDKELPKGSRNGKNPVRRNVKYVAIDRMLCDISSARPKNHEEVFRFLDDREVAIPNRRTFKAGGGWVKGFQQDRHAASAWLSQAWRKLSVPAFPPGPKK